MLQSLFRGRPQRASGAALYAEAVAQARRPEFYAQLGVADRIDVRFELYTAHVLLLLLRLKGAGEEAAEVSQALFDTYLSALDDTLRELGVGDLSVSKKMRKLGETLYARIRAYEQALAADAAPSVLDGLVAHALFADDAAAAAPMAGYVRRAHQALADQPIRAILKGKPTWPPVLT